MEKTECLFTFGSTHAAISGEECLVNGGVSVRVMAKPDVIGAGCGLCLRVDVQEKAVSCTLLNAHKVSIENVFLATKSQHGTEYTLWKDL